MNIKSRLAWTKPTYRRWSGLPVDENGNTQFPMVDENGEPLTEKDRKLMERLNASQMVNGRNYRSDNGSAARA